MSVLVPDAESRLIALASDAFGRTRLIAFGAQLIALLDEIAEHSPDSVEFLTSRLTGALELDTEVVDRGLRSGHENVSSLVDGQALPTPVSVATTVEEATDAALSAGAGEGAGSSLRSPAPLVQAADANTTVTRKVKLLLFERNLRAKTLADLTGIDPSRLSRLLSGDRAWHLGDVVAIAAATNTPIAWFLEGTSR